MKLVLLCMGIDIIIPESELTCLILRRAFNLLVQYQSSKIYKISCVLTLPATNLHILEHKSVNVLARPVVTYA